MQPSRRHCLFASLAFLALCMPGLRASSETGQDDSASASDSAPADSAPSASVPLDSLHGLEIAQITNQDVLEMNEAGLSSVVILAKISAATCGFDTSPSALESLKESGIDNSVLAAMIKCRTSLHAQPQIWIGAEEDRASFVQE
jgi:hypothetical protein